MGRWRRKKHYYNSQKQSSSSTDNSSNSERGGGGGKEKQGNNDNNNNNRTTILWTWNDKKKLIKYLQDYKSGAERVNKGITTNNNKHPHHRNNNHRNNNNNRRRNHNNKKNHYNNNNGSSSSNNNDNPVVLIGNKKFVALTDAVLSEPYLELPKELSSKERKFVHETCVDVGLYHCGIGKDRWNRYVIISIYSDGFTHLKKTTDDNNYNGALLLLSPKAQQELDDKLLYRCKPWFCRTDPVVVEAITKQFQQRIESLMDQPTRCIRDGERDAVDYRFWEQRDLSTIEPPGGGGSSEATTSHNDDDDDDDGCSSNWMLVDTEDKMKQCIKELTESKPSEIAFDLEAQNVNKYTQRTCLLQITSNSTNSNNNNDDNNNNNNVIAVVGKEYIIDPLAPGVWDAIHGLAPLFADPGIVKIGHSVGSIDVRSLHRDFGVFVVNVFDTYEASKILGLPHHGLNDVCRYYGMDETTYSKYTDLKAELQITDWRVRPLTEPMIRYARSDVRYLLALRRFMIRDLTRKELFDDKLQNDGKLNSFLGNSSNNGTLIQQALEAYSKIEQQEDGNEHNGNEHLLLFHDKDGAENLPLLEETPRGAATSPNHEQQSEATMTQNTPEDFQETKEQQQNEGRTNNENNDDGENYNTRINDDNNNAFLTPDTGSIYTAADAASSVGGGESVYKDAADADATSSVGGGGGSIYKDAADDATSSVGGGSIYKDAAADAASSVGEGGSVGRGSFLSSTTTPDAPKHETNTISEKGEQQQQQQKQEQEQQKEHSLSSASSSTTPRKTREIIARAQDLRMNADLMTVISNSLERSFDLWSDQPEPHLKNQQFKSTLQRQLTDWTQSHMSLYEELVEFRIRVAAEERCLPGFVCPLDFLVHVAAKRPTSIGGLQKISYFLPDLLLHGGGKQKQQQKKQTVASNNTPRTNNDRDGDHNKNNNSGYVEQLLDLVRKSKENDTAESSDTIDEDMVHFLRYDPSIKERILKQNMDGNNNDKGKKMAAVAGPAAADDNNDNVAKSPAATTKASLHDSATTSTTTTTISWKRVATISGIVVAATTIVVVAVVGAQRRTRKR